MSLTFAHNFVFYLYLFPVAANFSDSFLFISKDFYTFATSLVCKWESGRLYIRERRFQTAIMWHVNYHKRHGESL